MIRLMRTVAWIFRMDLVWLQDHDGEIVLRFAKQYDTAMVCYRTMNRKCILLEDWTVDGPSYVEKWGYV